MKKNQMCILSISSIFSLISFKKSDFGNIDGTTQSSLFDIPLNITLDDNEIKIVEEKSAIEPKNLLYRVILIGYYSQKRISSRSFSVVSSSIIVN